MLFFIKASEAHMSALQTQAHALAHSYSQTAEVMTFNLREVQAHEPRGPEGGNRPLQDGLRVRVLLDNPTRDISNGHEEFVQKLKDTSNVQNISARLSFVEKKEFVEFDLLCETPDAHES